MYRKYRPIIATLLIIITVGLFIRYFMTHPQYWQQLKEVSPWVIVWVLVLNALFTLVLTVINIVTLLFCGKRLKWSEMFVLTGYSSVANFFGPLQSGPGVRAAYLKTKHKVRLRDYTLASLLALGIFAAWSILFLLVGAKPWWQTLLALAGVCLVSWFVFQKFQQRDKQPAESQFRLHGKLLVALIALTFVQVCIIAGWYYVELRAVDPTISLGQAVSYSGAANFALFVSITPDAIGIREAFLVFSQHLHHVPTSTIISANVIDRAVYVFYLLGLFIVVLSMHATERLGITKLRRQAASGDER